MFLNLDKKPKESIAAIDDSGKKLTYGQMVHDCKEISKGIKKRELIFCLSENSCEALAGYISFYDNKDVPLLLSASMDNEFLDNLLGIYKPKYIWLPQRMAGQFSFEIVGKYHSYALLEAKNATCPMAESLSFLLMTSGSTGSPKLVRHKYGNLESSARNVAKAFGWTDAERSICNLPMNYTMGLSVINSSLYAGAALLLTKTDMLDPAFWAFIKEQEGTNLTGVPYSYKIMKKLHFSKMQLPHLTTLAQGGGKLPDCEFKEIAEYVAVSGKRFFATYGTTETSARVSFLPPESAVTKCGSIGKVIYDGEMFLTDEDGKEIKERCAEGELVYKGPNVTMGYADCRDDLLLEDEFCGTYYTGDMAKRDPDGFYYITGRKKRFLKLYGLRVSLDRCEELISNEIDIECACTGNDTCMEIYITDVSYANKLKKYISQKTGLVSRAFNVRAVSEIPKNSSGKIQYHKLQ